MQVAVLGLGAWGTALALHCARCGHHVIGWTRDAAAAQRGNTTRRVPFQGTEVVMPDNLTLTAELTACAQAEMTIVALPARAWSQVAPHLPPPRAEAVIVSAAKGITTEDNLTPLGYLRTILGWNQAQLVVVSGPSFASDLQAQRPLSLVAASRSTESATRVAAALANRSVRMYTSTDPVGVELGGILKNVIAIAAGVSDALNYGPSARAAIITRGLAEITRLATALGADPRTLAGLSGLGDLVMTATENQSRNRTVGLRLGRGEPIDVITTSLGAVAEGVTTAPLALELAIRAGIEAPITEHMVRLLRAEITPTQLAESLISRRLKAE
jgi:glycerol-3-phosphate dehydrogenase (NAD(P)+)